MMIGDHKVGGFELNSSVVFRLAGKDASGDSNSTARSDKGTKAKVVNVQVMIKYSDHSELSSLTALAEARDSDGKRIIYDLVDRTANAMNIRRVEFSDNFVAKPLKKQKVWRVSFNLSEIASVSELNQKKLAQGSVVAQNSQGEQLGPVFGNESEPVNPVELTFTEEILKSIDDALKPDETA